MAIQNLQTACDQISAAIAQLQQTRPVPLLVALDGGSGSGKSTLAALLAQQLDAVIIPQDDFLAAHISEAEFDALPPAERGLAAIDWQRVRQEALEPLLAGQTARWHAFDFTAGVRPDGTYGMLAAFEERQPAPVIILDGMYATRPELADLIDLAVLVEASVAVRHARLVPREEAGFLADWHKRWDSAEDYYLTHVRPPESFDLVVRNGVE